MNRPYRLPQAPIPIMQNFARFISLRPWAMSPALTRRWKRRVGAAALLIAAMVIAGLFSFAGAGRPVHGQALPTGQASWPRIELSLVFSGLTEPTHATHAGDGSGRLFLV